MLNTKYTALDKFRFECIRDTRCPEKARVVWITPGGRRIAVGDIGVPAIEAPGPTGQVTLGHPLFPRTFAMLRAYLRSDMPPANCRAGVWDWLGRLHCKALGQAEDPDHGERIRHKLTPDQRYILGRLVAEHVQGNASYDIDTTRLSCEQIVSYLDLWAASPSILDRINQKMAYGCHIGLGICGHFHGSNFYNSVYRGHTICSACVANQTYVEPVDACGYMQRTETYEHSNGFFYTRPEEQGSKRGTSIHYYRTNVMEVLDAVPPPTFKNGPFAIGVELEVYARRGKRDALAESVTAQAPGQFIFKDDGSLESTRGVELVTVPMTCEQAVSLFAKLKFPKGTTAWDTRKCGMHIHIDSHAFTRSSIAKFLSFWNDEGNARFIRLIAGRHPDFDDQASCFAARVKSTGDVYQKAHSAQHTGSRYRIVNLCNLGGAEIKRLGLSGSRHATRFNTVELRIFRATLNKNRLLAQIEMAVASVYFARRAALDKTGAQDFKDWLAGNTVQFPHLAAFLDTQPGAGACRIPMPKAPVIELVA